MKALSTEELIKQLFNDPVFAELFQQLIQEMKEINLVLREIREMREQQKEIMKEGDKN